MSDIQPFSPQQARDHKIHTIPSFVIDAVNELLVVKMSGKHATVKVNDIIELALKKQADWGQEPAIRQDFYNKGWLNFEGIYKERGWKVTYDQPGWDESYDSFYRFEEA